MTFGIVLARPGDRAVVTGLTLAERGRRVLVRAGIPEVRVVTTLEELAQARAAARDAAVVVVRTTGQVVAGDLVAPLRPFESGTRVATDARGYAGALRAEGVHAAALWVALAADLDGGDATVAAGWPTVGVGARARHPAATPDEIRAADAWQFELIHKPLDSFLCRHLFRPLARPLTRLLLPTPITPNQITIASIVASLVGCWIAAGPSWSDHVLGLGILFLGGVLDANDGEIARLRLEGSAAGAWLDAIGDDLARIALILGVGGHVAQLHPELPLGWAAGAAAVMTLIALALIYWYCIFVIKSSNNQDYTNLLGVGPGQGDANDRSLKKILGDLGAQAARRDFIDPAALFLALIGLPEVMFVGLVIGAVITLAIVIPTHLKLVRSLRAERAERVVF
jgi:phosphatidylglycerophosphate synthase